MIFVALALVWAVVLIPKALRHHDEVARTRSVADVSDEVRVVTRRGASVAGSTPAEPAPSERHLRSTPHQPASQAQSQAQSQTQSRSQTPSPARSARRPTSGTPTRRATARAAARRRRILAVLLLADVLVGAGAVTGLLRPWAPAVSVVLTLAFLVVARVTVRRERARRLRALQRRRRAAQSVAAPVSSVPVAAPTTVVAPAPSVEPVAAEVVEQAVPEQRNAQGLNVVSGLDDTSSIPVVRVPDEDPSGSLWDPLPVTLPTYVTKPRASRSVRTIDLSAPDVSSSGRSSAASALVAEAATTAAAGDDGAARAVGS
ncbi:MAG: hypothetical protein QOK15_397 [Nocardioidaceae bacterium]|nr:hypothetical protein [Nocardioidaceae bacterium]